MSNSHKRSRVAESIEKVEQDEELLCVICTELVCNARQANCCGSIYCNVCIEKWLTTKANGSCPSCRASLKIGSLVVDKRSERQSAAHPRNCQYYLRGCSFVGDRKEVAVHEMMCKSNPSVCTSEYCRALQSRELARNLYMQTLEIDRKKQLLAAVWLTPEQNLQKLYGLGLIKIFIISSVDRAEYRYHFALGSASFTCKLEVKHHNVSIVCWPDSRVTESHTCKFVLIHPSDPLLNREISITMPANSHRESAVWGNFNWMTAREFEAFAKDGKFAFGG